MDKATQRLAKQLKDGVKIPTRQPSDYVSTGSTLLNCACSGNPFWGYAKGFYYFIVGDHSSGKTFLTLTCLAEAARNRAFDDFRFIYNPTSEDGAQMDIAKFFGKRVAQRLEYRPTDTLEEFYDEIERLGELGPFIYILDSESGLTSEDEDEKADENRARREKGSETKGEIGVAKAKKHSAGMRRACRTIRKTRSILLVLSQTRDKVGVFFGDPKTRGGGRALSFYSTLEMWSSVKNKITRKVRGKDRVIGTTSRIKFRRNRFCGFEDDVLVDHYKDTGFDDIGSCIDFLVEEKHWKEVNGIIMAKDFRFNGTREAVIAFIEAKNYEKDLSLIVGQVWKQIQEACIIERKQRYE